MTLPTPASPVSLSTQQDQIRQALIGTLQQHIEAIVGFINKFDLNSEFKGHFLQNINQAFWWGREALAAIELAIPAPVEDKTSATQAEKN